MAVSDVQQTITGVPSYNAICHFVPGVLFAHLLDVFLNFSILAEINTDNDFTEFVAAIVIYFCAGVFINRLGSIFLSINKQSKLETKKEGGNWYDNYVLALDKDPGIEKLIIMKELYKSLFAIAVIMPVLYFYFSEPPVIVKEPLIFVADIVLLFLVYNSYKSQNEYINKRISLRSRECSCAAKTQRCVTCDGAASS